MVLFQAGNNDFSNKILRGTYNVQKKDVTFDWEDGNKVEHRDPLRTRVEGTFQMFFADFDEYNDFLTEMAKVKTGTIYILTVYAINTNEAVVGNYFLDFAPELRQNNNLTYSPGNVTVNIREA